MAVQLPRPAGALVLAPEIRDAFQLTNTDYARIVFAFQLSYMLSSAAGGGWLIGSGAPRIRADDGLLVRRFDAACLSTER